MTKRSFAWRQRQGFAVEAREPVKSIYHRELWNNGPVASMARTLAKLELMEQFNKKGKRFDLLSEKEQENAITVLLFNSEDVFLKRAKWKLGL